MARLPSVTVFAINVAIVDKNLQTPDHYLKLLRVLYEARKPVRIARNETELFFGWLAPELEINDTYARGLVDRAVDVQNREWYNEIKRQPASDEEVNEINIPDGLKANHREFMFLFDLNRHYMFVDNANRGSKIIPSHVAELLTVLTSSERIRRQFGLVTVSVVKSKIKLEEILKNEIKSLSMTIQQNNGDFVSSELRDSVLEQMQSALAEQAEIALKAPSGGRLNITDEIRALAEAAADTGDVRAKVVIDGYTKNRNLSEYPVEATEKYDPRNEERFSGMLRAIRVASKYMKKWYGTRLE